MQEGMKERKKDLRWDQCYWRDRLVTPAKVNKLGGPAKM